MSPKLSARVSCLVALLGLLLVGATSGGCDLVQKQRMKMLGITVDSPDKESAEWVIQQAVIAGLEKDEEKGWEKFQTLLHTDQRTPGSLRGWKEGAWGRLHRQAKSYAKDDKGTIVLRDIHEMQNNALEIFVENAKSDMPTPCTVQQDKGQGGLWRITRCSL